MTSRSEAQVWEQAHAQGTFDDLAPEPSLVAFVPLLQAAGARRVLDLGCGGGRHLMYLQAQGFQPVGVDFASVALRRAGEVMNLSLAAKRLVRADMLSLPLRYRSFSAAVSYNVIYHGVIDDVRRALREVHRVLRPGGVARMNFLADSHPRFEQGERVSDKTYRLSRGADAGAVHRFFARDELESMLDECGFVIGSIEGLLGDREQGNVTRHWLATFWVPD